MKADDENYLKLVSAFPELFEKYHDYFNHLGLTEPING